MKRFDANVCPFDAALEQRPEVFQSVRLDCLSVSQSLRTGNQINIAAFTDHRALGKWLSSQKGSKIVFDIVRGRSIELGI
jgi:hypothetical protein